MHGFPFLTTKKYVFSWRTSDVDNFTHRWTFLSNFFKKHIYSSRSLDCACFWWWGGRFWVSLMNISLNIFFRKKLIWIHIKIINCLKNTFKKIITRSTQKLTPSPSKTCAIERSRGVDVFKKKVWWKSQSVSKVINIQSSPRKKSEMLTFGQLFQLFARYPCSTSRADSFVWMI